jgi:hypothetical protein
MVYHLQVEVDWEKINQKIELELEREQRPSPEKAAAKPARH